MARKRPPIPRQHSDSTIVSEMAERITRRKESEAALPVWAQDEMRRLRARNVELENRFSDLESRGITWNGREWVANG